MSVAPANYITAIFPTFHRVKAAGKYSTSPVYSSNIVTVFDEPREHVTASSARLARITMSQKPRI